MNFPRLQRYLKILLGLFLLLTQIVFSQVGDAQDVPDVCPTDFAGFLQPRLVTGQRSRVLRDIVLNIRPEPTTQIARIGLALPLTTFDVIDGPRCADEFVWWRGHFADDMTGWVAEGDPAGGTYWLEPRGIAVTMPDHNGVLRRFVQIDDTLEREGCLRPPEDYTIAQLDFARLNRRTLAMLDNAQRIYQSYGGEAVNFRQLITQGSYNPGGVDASFGTHDGGGAIDISVRNFRDFSVMEDEILPMLDALRVAGFAAWLRDTGELYDDSPIHIHAIAIGDAEASEIARRQVVSEFGYLRGFNGLPPEDGASPIPDIYGPPVICAWMIDDGFVDMRNIDGASSP